MKTNNRKLSLVAIVIVLVITLSLMLFACGKKTPGPQGPAGANGEQGIQGPPGADGKIMDEDEYKFLKFKLYGPTVSEATIESWFTYSDDITKLDITGLTDEGKKQTVLYFPNKDGIKLKQMIAMDASNAKEIYINPKLNFLGNYLHYNITSKNALEELYIDKEVGTTYNYIIFNAINLKKVVISKNAFNNHYNNFFIGSNNIESIKFLGLSENIYQENGNIFIKKIIGGEERYLLFATTKDATSVNEKITDIGSYSFMNRENLDKEITLKNVINIQQRAFLNTKLESIILNDGIKFIETLAFSKTKLTEISIPSSVETVGASILANCENLKTIRVAWAQGDKPDGWSEHWAKDIPDDCTIVYGG